MTSIDPKTKGSLESISKSLFMNASAKKDSPPMKQRPFRRSPQKSPTSIVVKSIFDNKDTLVENLSSDSLFSAIRDLNWRVAESRISSDEASTWVAQHDNLKNKMIWRRLPIHEAAIRQAPAALIAALIEAHPEGAQTKDNQGRTPLSCAVIHGAEIDVVYLLLNASYDIVNDQDFFSRIPRDYAYTTTFSHKAEVINALCSKSREDVEIIASRIKARIKSEHPIHGAVYKLKAQLEQQKETEREEEMQQALAEVEAAYTIRDVAVANEQAAKMQIQELKDEMVCIKKDLELEIENKERQESCVFMLEKKNQTLMSSISEKDAEIEKLKEQVKKDAEQRKSDSVMRQKLKKTIASLSERLNENSEESIEYWKAESERLQEDKMQAEEKQKSLEELLQVYMDRSHDLEEKYKLTKEKLFESEKTHGEKGESQEEEVAMLRSDLQKAQEENSAMTVIVNNYHEKLTNVEKSFDDMSTHLIERSNMLKSALDDIDKLESEKSLLVEEKEDMESRVQSLEALIGEYSSEQKDTEELIAYRQESIEKIKELEDLIMEYDQENTNLENKCIEYEREIEELTLVRNQISEELEMMRESLTMKDEEHDKELLSLRKSFNSIEVENEELREKCDAYELKIEDCKMEYDRKLAQSLNSMEVEKSALKEKCDSYKHKLDACKREFDRKLASLQDLVRMYREKASRIESYEAETHKMSEQVKHLEEKLAKVTNDKKLLKRELAKTCERKESLSTSVNVLKDYSKGLKTRNTNLERSHQRATEQLIDRTLKSSPVPPPPSRSRYSTPRKIYATDNDDCMSVSTALSQRSFASYTSATSITSNSSSTSRRSSSLALRTQRALKHRISSRQNQV
jgi:predicted  nucleic acid-binding Zn-ribbon protein